MLHNTHKISLAFVPDGNRRWAKSRGKTTLAWHAAGAKKFEEILQFINGQDRIDEVFFWALSRANLDRDPRELRGIFSLLKKYFISLQHHLVMHRVAFLAFGETYLLPQNIQDGIRDLEDMTREFMHHKRFGMGLAYDRDLDLIRATQIVLQKYPHLRDPADIETFLGREWWYARWMRNPDILIRTGSSKGRRTSGAFMGRETEIVFTETLWPDFSLEMLQKIIQWTHENEHTYGL